MKFYLSPLRAAMSDRRLVLVMAVSLLFALAYNGVIVPGYAPDEGRHMNYVRLLWNEHRLPFIESREPYSEYKGAHAFHPPLYHLLLLPLFVVTQGMPGDSAWHVIRLVSTLLCVATLPMIYVIGTLAGKGDIRVGLLSAALTGLLPMFGMTASTINNDSATLFFTVLFLYMLLLSPPELSCVKKAIFLGIVLALGGWSKATALLCGGAAAIVWPLALRKSDPSAAGRQWQVSGIALLLGAILVSPWHLRSFNLYHQWNPMPTPAPWFTPPLPPLLEIAHPDFPGIFGVSNWAMFYTLWAQRDWLRQEEAFSRVQPPPLQGFQAGVFYLLAVVCLLAVLGHVLKAKGKQLAGGPELWPALASFIAAWLAVLFVALFVHQGWAEGGRYLLPAFCGFAIWLVLGWRKLFGVNLKMWGLGLTVFFCGLNVVCLQWILGYLNPHYVH